MNNKKRGGQYSDVIAISPGAYVELGVTLEKQVFIGANAVVLVKDQLTGEAYSTLIKTGAAIGANATVCPGIIVGERAVVKPGSVVTRSVPPLAIVQGNPAIIIGYVSTYSVISNVRDDKNELIPAGVTYSKVSGVTLHKFQTVFDMRGNLSVGEFEREIPFNPKRYFLVFDVPTAETRGEHAHHVCHQFLIAVKGSVSVVADDGDHREEFVLDKPSMGVYLPPMTWGIQYRYSADAVLLVFASEHYDAADYIRDYSDFLKLKEERALVQSGT